MYVDSQSISGLRMHTMFSDGMILQRDANVSIWGFAKPSSTVTVDFLGNVYKTESDLYGNWLIVLKKYPAGGPYEMRISCDREIVIRDIFFGDVFLCAGQSNMQLPMERVKYRYPEVYSNDEYPLIRQFLVPEHYDYKRENNDTEKSCWEAVTHETIGHFTAAGYFFAKELYSKYHVPIGLINTAIGGSAVESWLSEENLNGFPEIIKTARLFINDTYRQKVAADDDIREKDWYQRLDDNDVGLHDPTPWYAADYNDEEWPVMQVPNYWTDEGFGAVNGSFWFRRTITLPEELAGKPATLFMGRIVDADYCYVNGTLVGNTGYQYPPRIYDIPSGLLKAGKNIIAIRVINCAMKGGFISEKPYRLVISNHIYDLCGKWKCRLGCRMESLKPRTFLFSLPVGLYNGMLSAIAGYAIRGVIWYQGESNTSRPENYEVLFKRLIKQCREKWKQKDLPFIYVQLPNYLERENPEAVGKWALLREAQLKSLDVPNTAMAVAIDIGEWNDLHPLNKADIGKRLALAAQKIVYGEKIVHMGPICESMKINGSAAVLEFANIGSGLEAKGGSHLNNFEIAGADAVFYSADAVIRNNKVYVTCDKVQSPAAVRYAWSDSPKDINFYNKEGLPASPFRVSIKSFF